MDKFLNRSRKAELEPNQNNAFLEEIPSTSSGQKKNKNSDVKKIQKKLSFIQIYFHCECHKTYSVARSMWRKAIQQCCGLKQTYTSSATETSFSRKQAGRLFSSVNQIHRETGHLYE